MQVPQLCSTPGALTGFPYIPASATADPPFTHGASATPASSPTCQSLVPGVALLPEPGLAGTPGESASRDGRVLSPQRPHKDQGGSGLPVHIQDVFSHRCNVFKGVCVIY